MKHKIYFILLLSIVFSLLTTFYNYDVESVKAQDNSSTIWRERKSYVPSYLVETDTKYIYVTNWGNYTFNKLTPYICKYNYRDGRQVVSFSTFWINTTKHLTRFNGTVIEATNTTFIVSLDAYRLVKKSCNNNTNMGL